MFKLLSLYLALTFVASGTGCVFHEHRDHEPCRDVEMWDGHACVVDHRHDHDHDHDHDTVILKAN